MANIGDRLEVAEAGWTRYDNLCKQFLTNDTQATDARGYKGGYYWLRNKGDYVKFKFTGDKIRIIGVINHEAAYPGGLAKIKIDGVEYEYMTEGPVQIIPALVFEKTGLGSGMHSVEIYNDEGGHYIWFDAIDIDESGEIYPIIGVPVNLVAVDGGGQANLSWNVASDAISYNVKRSLNPGGPYITIATDVKTVNYVDKDVEFEKTYYYVVTAVNNDVESYNSNEASVTIADNRKFLLRITMNDSSEREYQRSIKEVEAFIAWCNRAIGTGSAYYIFDKMVGEQKSKEYLFFEKIISFEVI